MKIPYMKEMLLLALGINTSVLILSLTTGNWSGIGIASVSGLMCVLGLYSMNDNAE
tara:strand:- start:199 stop:366 length:168 start_codon:yes stop_codon:yes gene_type:complete